MKDWPAWYKMFLEGKGGSSTRRDLQGQTSFIPPEQVVMHCDIPVSGSVNFWIVLSSFKKTKSKVD